MPSETLKPQITIGKNALTARLDELELEGYMEPFPYLAGVLKYFDHSWLITDASKADYQDLHIPVDTLVHSDEPIKFCEVGPGNSELSQLLAQRQPITIIEPFPYEKCDVIVKNLLEQNIPEPLKQLVVIWGERIFQYINNPNIARYALTLDQALQTYPELHHAFDVVVATGVQFADRSKFQNSLMRLVSPNGHIYPE